MAISSLALEKDLSSMSNYEALLTVFNERDLKLYTRSTSRWNSDCDPQL